MKYTGKMDEDFNQKDCPLIVEILAETVAFDVLPEGHSLEEGCGLGRAILARFRWVYHHNKKWAKTLIKQINGPSGGRDYLADFMAHWAGAFIQERDSWKHRVKF